MSVRSSNWVSKTDLIRYLRCPYAFYVLDRGLVAFQDTVNQQQARLIEEGMAFQTRVESATVPRTIKPVDLPRVFAGEAIQLHSVPLFENTTLENYAALSEKSSGARRAG